MECRIPHKTGLFHSGADVESLSLPESAWSAEYSIRYDHSAQVRAGGQAGSLRGREAQKKEKNTTILHRRFVDSPSPPESEWSAEYSIKHEYLEGGGA